MNHPSRRSGLNVRFAAAALLSCAGAAWSQAGAPDLASYFGFDDPRYIVVDDGFGPVLEADIDGDGRTDLIAVNNRKSRIEIQVQREQPRTDSEMERDYKTNELPPSPYFDRTEVSVAHRITAIKAHDVNADGMLDLIYAARTGELVVLEQTSRMSFKEGSKRRINGLAAGQDGLAVADVMGNSAPEVLAAVGGRIHVYSFTKGGAVGEPEELGSTGELVAFFVEDYNGDGMLDVLGIVPDDDAPLRLWLQAARPGAAGKDGLIGPEHRFEMPMLVEAEPVRFTGRSAASIGVIERASRRILFYDLASGATAAASEEGVERDAPLEVHAFRGTPNKDRSVAIADVNGDGLTDLVTTDSDANSVVLHLQASGAGLQEGVPFSSFKKPKTVALGQWNDDAPLELFVLSEEEKAVGVARFDAPSGRFTFPEPLPVKTAGAAPVAMNVVTLKSGPAVAVIVKDKRDHALEVHRPGDSEVMTLTLEGVSRPPQSLMGGDFDHDGGTDLLLFTPGEPMVMVHGIDSESPKLLTDKTMPQFGLVQAAGPDNTASLDFDADGTPELLIATDNFVRACTFSTDKGWRVIEQVTVPQAGTSLVGLAVADLPGSGPTLVAGDKSDDRLVLISKRDGAWKITDRMRLSGFTVGPVRAGAFAGDNQPTIMCLSEGGFALVRMASQIVTLEEFAAWRADNEDMFEHEMEVGDLNSDGYLDVVVLDAAERMCQVFTFSASRKLHLATEFEVFESRLFARGDSREFEPSAAFLSDVTGDGAPDLTLKVHDRLIVYPQMVAPR